MSTPYVDIIFDFGPQTGLGCRGSLQLAATDTVMFPIRRGWSAQGRPSKLIFGGRLLGFSAKVKWRTFPAPTKVWVFHLLPLSPLRAECLASGSLHSYSGGSVSGLFQWASRVNEA